MAPRRGSACRSTSSWRWRSRGCSWCAGDQASRRGLSSSTGSSSPRTRRASRISTTRNLERSSNALLGACSSRRAGGRRPVSTGRGCRERPFHSTTHRPGGDGPGRRTRRASPSCARSYAAPIGAVRSARRLPGRERRRRAVPSRRGSRTATGLRASGGTSRARVVDHVTRGCARRSTSHGSGRRALQSGRGVVGAIRIRAPASFRRSRQARPLDGLGPCARGGYWPKNARDGHGPVVRRRT